MKEKDSLVKAGQALPQIQIDEKALEHLRETVRQVLKENLRIRSEVTRFLKTENTLEHSLGNLYSYFLEEKECEECPGKLDLCPKRSKGNKAYLYYDENKDQIEVAHAPCPYQKERLRLMEKISPCDRSRNAIYQDVVSLLSSEKIDSTLAKMKDMKKAVLTLSKDLKDLKAGKEIKGYAFYSINGESLSQSLLSYLAYFSASLGLSVAYLKSKSFFSSLNDSNASVVQRANEDYRKALDVQVLIFDNFSEYYSGDPSFSLKYLKPLLEKRKEKGKATYFSLTSSYTLLQKMGHSFYSTDYQEEAKNWVKEKTASFVIHDIDVR